MYLNVTSNWPYPKKDIHWFSDFDAEGLWNLFFECHLIWFNFIDLLLYSRNVNNCRKSEISLERSKFHLGIPVLIRLHGSWDWIKNLLSLVPRADSKIVQLDLLGVVVVFFSFISWLHICFSLYFHKPFGQHAYKDFYSLAWAFCSSLIPSGPKCVSARSDWLSKETKSDPYMF